MRAHCTVHRPQHAAESPRARGPRGATPRERHGRWRLWLWRELRERLSEPSARHVTCQPTAKLSACTQSRTRAARGRASGHCRLVSEVMCRDSCLTRDSREKSPLEEVSLALGVLLIPLYYYGFYWQARQSTHKAVRAPGTGSLGCFKALQWAGCFRSFAQRHQLRRVSEQREEDPQLDELCIRNLDLEEVDSPLLNLQAAAGRVRASGIAVGARASATCVSTSTTTNRSNGVSFALTSSVIPRYARLAAVFTSSATCWFCIAAADAACTPTASSTGVRS